MGRYQVIRTTGGYALRCVLDEEEQLDDETVCLLRDSLPGIPAITLTDENRIIYGATSLPISLGQFVKQGAMNRPQALLFIRNLLILLQSAKWGVPTKEFDLDFEHIFIDPQTSAVNIFVLPVQTGSRELTQDETVDFLRSVIAHLYYFEGDRDNYVARMLNAVNYARFDIEQMKTMIEGMVWEQLGKVPDPTFGRPISPVIPKDEERSEEKQQLSAGEGEPVFQPVVSQGQLTHPISSQEMEVIEPVTSQPAETIRPAVLREMEVPRQAPREVDIPRPEKPQEVETIPSAGPRETEIPQPTGPREAETLQSAASQEENFPQSDEGEEYHPENQNEKRNKMTDQLTEEKTAVKFVWPGQQPQKEQMSPLQHQIPRPEETAQPQQEPVFAPHPAELPQSEHQEPERPMVPTPKLFRKNTGERIDIDRPVFKIGKSHVYADYVVDGNPAISRVHAMILEKDGKYYIKDNASTNGTYVNGRRVAAGQEIILEDQANIRLGDELFLFEEG